MNWEVQIQPVKTSMLNLYPLQHPSKKLPGPCNTFLIFSIPHLFFTVMLQFLLCGLSNTAFSLQNAGAQIYTRE